MIEQKKKMRLDELKIESFVTDQTLEIVGGTGWFCRFAFDYAAGKFIDDSLAGQCNPGTWAGSMNGQCGTSYP